MKQFNFSHQSGTVSSLSLLLEVLISFFFFPWIFVHFFLVIFPVYQCTDGSICYLSTACKGHSKQGPRQSWTMWLRVLCHQLLPSLSLAPQLLVSQDSGMASYHLVMFFFFSTPLVCDSSHFILSLFVSLAIHLVTVVEFVLIRVVHHLSCSLFECLKCSTSWLFQGYWQWRFFVIPTPTVWLSPIGARLFCCLGALSAVSVWDVATWGMQELQHGDLFPSCPLKLQGVDCYMKWHCLEVRDRIYLSILQATLLLLFWIAAKLACQVASLACQNSWSVGILFTKHVCVASKMGFRYLHTRLNWHIRWEKQIGKMGMVVTATRNKRMSTLLNI